MIKFIFLFISLLLIIVFIKPVELLKYLLSLLNFDSINIYYQIIIYVLLMCICMYIISKTLFVFDFIITKGIKNININKSISLIIYLISLIIFTDCYINLGKILFKLLF